MAKETILIASPLEREYVERILAHAPSDVTILYDPENLPVPRYVADHKGSEDFRRSPSDEARFRAALAQATILWDFPPAMLQERNGLKLAPNLKWAQTTSSGVGQMVNTLGLVNNDLIVTTARGVHAIPLAEFAMMALLAHKKRLAHLQHEQKNHRWERYCGVDLPGQTMTVVGAGQVGAEVGRLAKAFGMRVVAVVNTPAPERKARLNADEVCGPADLEYAIAQADCVVVCTPHTPQTEGMIGSKVIAGMKPGVVFINIGRGLVVDQAALTEALKSGHIGFAALDVAEVEPLPPDSPLWDLPNVLISPHSASTTEGENARITDIFLKNLDHFLAGETDSMINILDKKKMY